MVNSTQITIPRTVASATKQLAELGGIVTATEWHRAAIVAAYVEPASHGGNRTGASSESNLLTASGFADLDISGLTSTGTVLIYARAWLDRFPRPKPGSRVTLPTDGWPPTTFEDKRTSAVIDREAIIAQAAEDGTGAAKALDVAKNTAAMAAAIVASPAVAKAASAALSRRTRDKPPLPEPPFGGGLVQAYPGESEDGERIDFLAALGTAYGHVRTVRTQLRKNPHLAQRDDVQRQVAHLVEQWNEIGSVVADIANGVTDADLADLLADPT